MIKPAFLLLILIAASCLLSCKKPRKAVSVTTSADYNKGASFYNVNNDSAFYYFNKLVTSSGDSLEIAAAYTYMGIIQSQGGDYFGSQESLLQSMKHLDERRLSDSAYLLSDFNELGRVSLSLKNYDAAIDYYDKALKLTENPNSRIIALSNKAVAYQKKQQYAYAVSIYNSILENSKTDIRRYARILSNMAFTKWLQNAAYPAAPELLKALEIQQNEKDNWGMNASYAHLSDYYTRSRPDSALIYAEKMYKITQQLNSPDDELEALQKMIALSQPVSAKAHFARYQYLNDSLQTSRNNAKNQFALIRYEVAKNKADNLSLQKDNAEKKFQVTLLLITLAILIIAAFFIYRLLQKRRQRLLREQQLKTSQRVHDVVANGIYHIMAKIEHEQPDKEMLLDDLEILYDQSRNISYDQPETMFDNYAELLITKLSSFGNTEVNVSIVGNEEATWKGIATKVKNELYYVLREFMINMKKHSGATSVVIKFERDFKGLKVSYADDGKGIPSDAENKNGLRNTENRIKAIHGAISFESSDPKGLKIQLSIPIE